MCEQSTQPAIRVGDFVFVESNPQNYPSYGEFAITRVTPNNLYGVSTKGVGYESQNEHQLQLVGEKAYRVISVKRDDAALLKFAADIRYFSRTKERGEKLHWVESVYTNCARIAGLLENTVVPMCGTSGSAGSTTVTEALLREILREQNGRIATLESKIGNLSAGQAAIAQRIDSVRAALQKV